MVMMPTPAICNNSFQGPTFIQQNVPLADKNWFKTGGAARFYAQPRTEQEFRMALEFARSENLDIFVLGCGANILVSDEGFSGLVIRPCLNEMTITVGEENKILVTAGAGVTMPDLITFCLENNILGLEEFSGIPGTVGGSVYINLHYFEFLLEQFIVSAQVIDHATDEIQTVGTDWFQFGYNKSRLQQEDYYLVSATFSLTRADDLAVAFARGRHKEIIRHRSSRYPVKNTCGSFFRNFHDNEVTIVSNGKKMIYVAYYLDKIGVKGQLKHGDAGVSYQHANMIVNYGSATSADIIATARAMQELVYKAYDIIPQPECRLIGFKEYPLL